MSRVKAKEKIVAWAKSKFKIKLIILNLECFFLVEYIPSDLQHNKE